jgi:hypothetical protein
VFDFLEMLLSQLTKYIVFDDYLSKKGKTNTKKCKNCHRRVSLELTACPFCKQSAFFYH